MSSVFETADVGLRRQKRQNTPKFWKFCPLDPPKQHIKFFCTYFSKLPSWPTFFVSN